jgi:hypothetical protein
LCPKCEEKVRKGDVSERDILVSEILAKHKCTGYDSLINLEKKLVIMANEKEAREVIGVKGSVASESYPVHLCLANI